MSLRGVLMVLALALAALLPALAGAPALPYARAGLTPRQAAAHLLSRLTFGGRPGEVDRVLALGLEPWVERQLQASLPETRLPSRFPDDGLYPQRARKLLRAVYAENQLAEVMADFWFNHFNVSYTDASAAPHVADYEETAIRPHALGRFRAMLGATARHPAMLHYLDNATSTAAASVAGGGQKDALGYGSRGKDPLPDPGRDPLNYGMAGGTEMRPVGKPARDEVPRVGINENYARELLELHTLGVDGGYTQADVEQVARAFTGWTVRDDRFSFQPVDHDQGPKRILGREYPGGRGEEEGEWVLDQVARDGATARHLARKLATRFVAEDPPRALVDRLAREWTQSDGDIRHVMRALVASPEFWQSRGRRIKSPFHLAVSAVRALGGEVSSPAATLAWVERMGQPLYAWPPPTGFPDTGASWISAGTLLARMNFGLALAAGSVEGVRWTPAAVGADPPPATPREALVQFAGVLVPERPIAGLEGLEASAVDPTFPARVAEAAKGSRPQPVKASRRTAPASKYSVPQVIGVLLGCPEFQRY